MKRHGDINDDQQEILPPPESVSEEDMPKGWRPSQEDIKAITGETKAPDPIIEASSSVSDTSDLEGARLDDAAQRLKQIEELRPENWAKLDIYSKKAALNAAGGELGEVYHHPNPPLLVEDMEDPNWLGAYGDGYRFNRDSGEIEGADYGIRMNTEGKVDYEKLLGDDPAAALETYAHEFRHSYQHEQANVYEKPQFQNLVDDPVQADEWSRNFRDYKNPDDDFDAYQNQPVEQDARNFASKLVRRVYG